MALQCNACDLDHRQSLTEDNNTKDRRYNGVGIGKERHTSTRARPVSGTPTSSDGANANRSKRKTRGSPLDADMGPDRTPIDMNGRMWPPGVSGNLAERGRAAMEKTAIDQPGVFFATCARLIGPEVKLTIEQTLPGNLSMEDWQVMREIVAAVRQAIPDANSKPPAPCSSMCCQRSGRLTPN